MAAKGGKAVSDAVSVALVEAHTNSVDYAKDRMKVLTMHRLLLRRDSHCICRAQELYADIGLPMPPDPNESGGAPPA